jgi:lipoic acid synthetase
METVLENTTCSKTRNGWAKLPIGQKYTELRGLVDKYSLICASGSCQTWVNAGVKGLLLL